MFKPIPDLPSRANCCIAILTIIFISSISASIRSEETTNSADKPSSTEHPYRLNHQLLLGVSSNVFLDSYNSATNSIDGASFGLLADFFALPILSLGLHYNHFALTSSILDKSKFSANTISFVTTLVPLANSSLNPYLSFGLGSNITGGRSTFVIQNTLGLQFRPSWRTWGRIGYTGIIIGSNETSKSPNPTTIWNLRAISRGIHIEIGIVY